MYQHIRHGMIRRLSDGASIPPDPDNFDYVECLKWVAKGNTILPRDAQDVADEAAGATKKQQSRADIATVRSHVKLQALAALNPAQVRGWVETNVNSLADAKDVLVT